MSCRGFSLFNLGEVLGGLTTPSSSTVVCLRCVIGRVVSSRPPEGPPPLQPRRELSTPTPSVRSVSCAIPVSESLQPYTEPIVRLPFDSHTTRNGRPISEPTTVHPTPLGRPETPFLSVPTRPRPSLGHRRPDITGTVHDRPRSPPPRVGLGGDTDLVH